MFLITYFGTLYGTSLPLYLFFQKSRLPSANIFFKGAMAIQKRCLASFKEHRISFSKILSSWHYPQKTGAWNENKKYGKGRNGGRRLTPSPK